MARTGHTSFSLTGHGDVYTFRVRIKPTRENPGRWGVYGNMKIYVLAGIAEEIYLLRDVDRQEAVRAANQRVRETGSKDVSILKDEIAKRAMTIIDREYLEAQREARKRA